MTYRSRIGCFVSTHASYSRVLVTVLIPSAKSDKNYIMKWTYAILFLAFVGLMILCMTDDPAIAKNPGPSQKVGNKVIQFLSKEEMDLFNKIKTSNTNIADISSHRQFLKYCLNMNVLPRGYERKLPMCVRKSSKELEEKLRNIDEYSTKERIKVTANH